MALSKVVTRWTIVQDGEEALARARVINYDALVVDIMLPKLDGLSLVGQLRADHVHTPVLILSAKARVEDRVKGLQSGADDYLTKPFAFSELLARIQALDPAIQPGPRTHAVGGRGSEPGLGHARGQTRQRVA